MKIRNWKQHAAAMRRIEKLFDAKPGTVRGRKLVELCEAVENFEKKAVKMK